MNYPWKPQVLKLPKWARVLSWQGLTYVLLSYYLSKIHRPTSKSLWRGSLRCAKMGILNTLGSSSSSSLDFVFNALSRADVKSSRSVHSCLKFICPLHYADVGEINRDLSIFFQSSDLYARVGTKNSRGRTERIKFQRPSNSCRN